VSPTSKRPSNPIDHVRPIRWAAALPILAVLLMLLPAGTVQASAAVSSAALPAFTGDAATFGSSTTAAIPAPAVPVPAVPAPGNSSAFNPPCYPVATGVCVSIADPGESSIVPQGSNRTSPVMPDCSQNLYLVVKSHLPLNASGGTSPTFGPHSPIALNVTGVLWNGDPYFSKYDNSIWHSNSHLWWVLIGDETNDKTYPWWYNVTISGKAANGALNFFPGEQVTWWIFLEYAEANSNYVGVEGPHLTFTCAGAWPYSPYPGAPHYGGPASTFLDTNISVYPRAPNWNDTVSVTVNTTQADVAPYNATIGAATLDLMEVSHGAVLANTSWSFNVTLNGAFGVTSTTTRIPTSYSQIAGATISYRVWIADTSTLKDWLVTPWTNYTVNGNGSFETGVFTEDLTLLTTPDSVLVDATGTAQLTPGQPLSLVVSSRNTPDAILAVQVLYTVAYPQLHETIHQTLELNRISSIVFAGKIPALPVDTIVNFSVLAWDFTDAIEQSSEYSYSVQTFSQFIGPVPSGLAFFYVYVFDNGSQTWVQGAQVQITGPNGVFNSVSNTTLGVSYANQSGTPFTPLLVQANATYNVTVTDNRFVPGGGNGGPNGPISVSVVATNPMTTDRALASTPNYIVLEQGDQILFYLNATAPVLPASPSVSTGAPLGTLEVAAAVGLLAATAAMIPLLMWWRQIKARRTIEEKRVTL
jgi:hypothetical protein